MPLSVQNIHSTIGDYQRNYLYMIFIEDIPASIMAVYPEFALLFQKEVDIYNKSAFFPDRKTDPLKIQWGGSFFNVPGVDDSTRQADFEFQDDEEMHCYDFFCALKDLTGNEDNHGSVYGVDAKFNMGVAKISVDKKTITAYRRLVGVRVYGVDASELKKDGNDICSVKVTICWDKNVDDRILRGKEI